VKARDQHRLARVGARCVGDAREFGGSLGRQCVRRQVEVDARIGFTKGRDRSTWRRGDSGAGGVGRDRRRGALRRRSGSRCRTCETAGRRDRQRKHARNHEREHASQHHQCKILRIVVLVVHSFVLAGHTRLD